MTSNLPTILSEIDDIQQVMSTDRAAYNRDGAMQARYRSLVAQKLGNAPTILEASGSQPLLPIASAKEFAAATGTAEGYHEYLKVMRTAADWVFALPAEEQRKFVASVEALPQPVVDAAIAEIMARPPSITPSTGRALDDFAAMPEGAVLMREWQHLAGRKLALVRERLFRVLDRLPERHWPAFMRWIDGLSVNCAIALYRKLAA